jgi:hypothetical protein
MLISLSPSRLAEVERLYVEALRKNPRDAELSKAWDASTP